MSTITKQQLIKLEQDLGDEVILKLYNRVHYRRYKDTVKKNNLKHREKHRVNVDKRKTVIDPEVIEKIKEMKNDGYNQTDIMKHLGISRYFVRKYYIA